MTAARSLAAEATRAWRRWRVRRCLDAIARVHARMDAARQAIDATAMDHVRDALAHQVRLDEARLLALWARWARLTRELTS